MKPFNTKPILTGLLLTVAITHPVLAQTAKNADDGTTLEQIIIFGRHSIRSSDVDPSKQVRYAVDPYPAFVGVPTGYLTPRGQEAARLLGGYFREYLLHEGLLTGNTSTDLSRAYFRANSIQRSNVTAAKFGAGLIPDATIPVHSYRIADPHTGVPAETAPLFDPIATKVATADPVRALTEIQGILGSGAALTSVYRGELDLLRSVLYPPGTQPTPGAPLGSIDPTTEPITLTAISPIPKAGYSINAGGLGSATDAMDPFVMQYADSRIGGPSPSALDPARLSTRLLRTRRSACF